MRRWSTLVAREALGYARSFALSVGARRRLLHRAHTSAPIGLFFVPGLGAESSQFVPLYRRLEAEVPWADAFDYRTRGERLATLGRALRRRLDEAAGRAERLIVIGHSLGGLLLRQVLSGDDPPGYVVGYLSVAAPLSGTSVGRLAPFGLPRELAPENLVELAARPLGHLRGRVYTFGAERDAFVVPTTRALLADHPGQLIAAAGHVSCLFSPELHDLALGAVRRIKALEGLPLAPVLPAPPPRTLRGRHARAG